MTRSMTPSNLQKSELNISSNKLKILRHLPIETAQFEPSMKIAAVMKNAPTLFKRSILKYVIPAVNRELRYAKIELDSEFYLFYWIRVWDVARRCWMDGHHTRMRGTFWTLLIEIDWTLINYSLNRKLDSFICHLSQHKRTLRVCLFFENCVMIRDKKLTYEKRPKYLSFQNNVHIDEKTEKNLRILHVAACNENTYQKPKICTYKRFCQS